jgi:hypothetical protein
MTAEVSDQVYVVSLEFTDAAGQRWVRDPHGTSCQPDPISARCSESARYHQTLATVRLARWQAGDGALAGSVENFLRRFEAVPWGRSRPAGLAALRRCRSRTMTPFPAPIGQGAPEEYPDGGAVRPSRYRNDQCWHGRSHRDCVQGGGRTLPA